MNINTIQKWFEDQDNIDEMLLENERHLKIWEREVMSLFPCGSRILDIGCGLGREAFALAESGFHVTGIDVSRLIIEQANQIAQKKQASVVFVHGNGKTLPFHNAAFDVVIIWAQTFGLIQGTSLKNQCIQECKRVLKTDGLLSYSGHDYQYVTDHYAHLTDGKKFYPFLNRDIYWDLFYPFELAVYAQNNGFTIIENREGKIYKPEDGVVLTCLAKKNGIDNHE